MKRLAVTLLVLAAFAAAAPRLAHAADGTAVAEVAAADGKLVPADVKVMKVGTTTLVKSFTALTGEGQTALAAGDYDLVATARSGGATGKLKVTVIAGKVQRFRVQLGAAVATSAATTIGRTLKGTVKTAAGANASGTVRIVMEVPLVAGAYTVKNLPAGTYKVEHVPSGKAPVTKAVTVGTTDQTVNLVVP